MISRLVRTTLPVLHLEFLGMIDGAVAVHQDHGGGEVEDAGGEDEHLHGAVVRLAHREGGRGQVEPIHDEHDEEVEADGGEPCDQDVE